LHHRSISNNSITIEDGRPVGRMYEDLHALPDLRWFWSITVFVGYRPGVTTSDRVATLDEAKARFLENCAATPRWRRMEGWAKGLFELWPPVQSFVGSTEVVVQADDPTAAVEVPGGGSHPCSEERNAASGRRLQRR